MNRLLACLAAVAVSASAPAAAENGVKIGFVGTFSGPAAAIGYDMRDGFNLGIEQLGRKMADRAVEIIYEDDAAKPEVGKQKTDKLIESDHVDFLTGYGFSYVLLVLLLSAVNAEHVHHQRQCRTVIYRRRATFAVFLLGVVAGRSGRAGDRRLSEPEGRQDPVPDRSQLCRG